MESKSLTSELHFVIVIVWYKLIRWKGRSVRDSGTRDVMGRGDAGRRSCSKMGSNSS
jgi:hypothetical protein